MQHDYKGMKDEDIIVLINSGDKEALDFLMERYKELAKKKACTMFLLGGDRDDLIQEAMIGLYKAIRDYRFERNTSFSTFAGLCMTRQLYSAVRYSNTMKNSPLNHYVPLYSSEDGQSDFDKVYYAPGPEETVVSQENVAWLENKLNAELSGLESAVLNLFLCGFDYLAISEKLGRTPKAVDNALQRIKRKLKHIMANMIS